jgi:hypothetical protein
VSLFGFIHSVLHVRTKLWRSDNHITTLQFRHPRLLCLFNPRLFRQSCDPVTSLGLYRLCGVVNLSDEFYRDSCLREQLDSHGVLKGQVRAGRASLGVGSPSTLGHPQSKTSRLSNIHPPEHRLSQISSETTLPLRFQGEHLEPTASSNEMLMGMNHEHGPPSQSHFMSSHNDNFENFNTQFPVPAQPENWPIAKRPEWTATGLVSDNISKMDDRRFLLHFCVYCMSLTSGSFIFRWFLQQLPCLCSIASGSHSRVPI